MLTMKFGGTSVGDIPRLQEVVAIVQSHLSRQPVVVASAMGGVTDVLLNTAQLAVQRETDQVAEKIDALKQRHLEVAMALVSDEKRREDLLQSQSRMFDELSNLYHGVGLLKELSVRSLDAIASFGEIVSCMQIAAILNDSNIPARFIDARTAIRTDAHFGEAAVDFSVTNENLRGALKPLVDAKIVPVVTGFIASTSDGITTTLGRSGSDYTGSIVARRWAVKKSGYGRCRRGDDGRPAARARGIVLPDISYREAAEMSYFGAKVIHPKTMMPAIENSIRSGSKTLSIRRTQYAYLPCRKFDGTGGEECDLDRQFEPCRGRRKRDGGGTGHFRKNFYSARARRVNVMMISQASSEHNVCVVIPQKDCSRAVKELREEFEMDIARKMSMT